MLLFIYIFFQTHLTVSLAYVLEITHTIEKNICNKKYYIYLLMMIITSNLIRNSYTHIFYLIRQPCIEIFIYFGFNILVLSLKISFIFFFSSQTLPFCCLFRIYRCEKNIFFLRVHES